VSASSVSFDLQAKLHVYRSNHVLEYLVWRVVDQAIDWFLLRNSQYEALGANAEGIFQSAVFPGLWLDPGALVRGDVNAVLQVLQQAINSADHAAFVTHLCLKRARLEATPPATGS